MKYTIEQLIKKLQEINRPDLPVVINASSENILVTVDMGADDFDNDKEYLYIEEGEE